MLESSHYKKWLHKHLLLKKIEMLYLWKTLELKGLTLMVRRKYRQR